MTNINPAFNHSWHNQSMQVDHLQVSTLMVKGLGAMGERPDDYPTGFGLND